jgi:hypothetical protein
MSVEQSVEWELAGETEVFGENLPQCHFVHHKSHMSRPGLEQGPPATNRLDWRVRKEKGRLNPGTRFSSCRLKNSYSSQAWVPVMGTVFHTRTPAVPCCYCLGWSPGDFTWKLDTAGEAAKMGSARTESASRTGTWGSAPASISLVQRALHCYCVCWDCCTERRLGTRDWLTDWRTDRQRGRHENCKKKKTVNSKHNGRHKLTERYTERQTERQRDIQADRETNTERHKERDWLFAAGV